MFAAFSDLNELAQNLKWFSSFCNTPKPTKSREAAECARERANGRERTVKEREGKKQKTGVQLIS